MNYSIRYIARFIVEAATPLSIGSDALEFDQDAPVAKDFNNLPYIPGTAITGFLRHKLKNLTIFGEDPDSDSDEPEGSNFICSDGYLLDDELKVHQQPEIIDNPFLLRYDNLPTRQHVAINIYGTASGRCLFDQELVFKGSRFTFEIALELEKKNEAAWKQIIEAFLDNDFYIGGGQFNNFGELKIKQYTEKCFDLKKENELDSYLEVSVDLNTPLPGKTFILEENKGVNEKENKKPTFTEQEITLSGDRSFLHFGAGFGENTIEVIKEKTKEDKEKTVSYNIDAVNYEEDSIVWKDHIPSWEPHFVIPGTSIKGAIAHRVAFYDNLAKGNTVERLIETHSSSEKKQEPAIDADNYSIGNTIEELEKQLHEIHRAIAATEKEVKKESSGDDASTLFKKYTDAGNTVVNNYFGTAKNKDRKGQKGKVIFKDIYIPKDEAKETIFFHNKIDRYTGGTVDGALYSEKVLYLKKEIILILKKEKINDEAILDKALNDLEAGRLPVGGMTNKGHGFLKKYKAQ